MKEETFDALEVLQREVRKLKHVFIQANELDYAVQMVSCEIKRLRENEKKHLPEPIMFSRIEGSDWDRWAKHVQSGTAHAILFDDGTVFDMYNGWRRGQHCTCCGALVHVK
jgi:hypothetical protein